LYSLFLLTLNTFKILYLTPHPTEKKPHSGLVLVADGVVLHQPLKRPIFAIFGQKR